MTEVAAPQPSARPAGTAAVVPRWARTIEIDYQAAAALTRCGELCWLADSVELAGWGTALRIPVAAGPDRFATAAALLAEHLAALHADGGPASGGLGPVAFASFTFDPNAAGSAIVLPRTLIGCRDGRAWLTVVGDRPVTSDDLALPAPRPAGGGSGRVRYAGTSATEIAWIDAVDRAVRRIRAGDAEKVVLARDRVVYSAAPFDATALVTQLRTGFTSCYTFRIDGLVGASPELLIRRGGARVESLVLAGTAPRGDDNASDATLGQMLLASAKDLAEHRPAVASVRQVLQPLVRGLDVDEEPTLLRLANVQHLATHVRGRLSQPRSALELAGRLHPTAAVGGTPTVAALQMIAELERIDRGRYAGPVGWVDADGNGEFAIALRCAQLDGARARLFAGAGIVADSLPEAELEETRLKLRAMQSAFEATA